MPYAGKVIKKHWGAGSKSEHEAVVLVSVDGEYKLRRQGGNPFVDPVLNGLVGKRIECHGVISGAMLLMSEWKIFD